LQEFGLFDERSPCSEQPPALRESELATFGYELPYRMLPSTTTIAIYYCYSAWKLILILLSHGW